MKQVSIADAALLGALILMLVWAVRPAGSVGRYLAESRDARSISSILDVEWERLTSLSSGGDSLAAGPLLIEVTDYQCSFCRQMHAPLKMLEDDGFQVAYLHSPLSRNARSDEAARAALCAERSGHFGEMHHQLMTTEEWPTGLA